MAKKFKRVDLEALEPVMKRNEDGYSYAEYKEVTIPHVVTAVKTTQAGRVIGHVGAILRKAKDNEQIMDYLKAQMGFATSKENEDKEVKDLMKELQGQNTENLFEVLVFLLHELPEETTELISELAGIDQVRADMLDIEETIKLLEAVIEVNEIQPVVTAIKEFVENLKRRFQKEADHQADSKNQAVKEMSGAKK